MLARSEQRDLQCGGIQHGFGVRVTASLESPSRPGSRWQHYRDVASRRNEDTGITGGTKEMKMNVPGACIRFHAVAPAINAER